MVFRYDFAVSVVVVFVGALTAAKLGIVDGFDFYVWGSVFVVCTLLWDFSPLPNSNSNSFNNGGTWGFWYANVVPGLVTVLGTPILSTLGVVDELDWVVVTGVYLGTYLVWNVSPLPNHGGEVSSERNARF